MKAMTAKHLMERAVEAEQAGDHILADREVKRALWLEKSGRSEAYFIGDCQNLPRFNRGDKVTVVKGTRITGTFPDSQADGEFARGGRYKTAKRTYKVAVHSVQDGYIHQDWPHRTNGIGAHIMNPQICFVGAGGYWCYLDLNDVPEAIALVQAATDDAAIEDDVPLLAIAPTCR